MTSNREAPAPTVPPSHDVCLALIDFRIQPDPNRLRVKQAGDWAGYFLAAAERANPVNSTTSHSGSISTYSSVPRAKISAAVVIADS